MISTLGHCHLKLKNVPMRSCVCACIAACFYARLWGTDMEQDGVRFEGWLNSEDELHGRGTMHFPDGGWQSCTWIDGVPNGRGEYVGEDWSIIRGTWVCQHVKNILM